MPDLVQPKSKIDVTKMIASMRSPKISVLANARKTDRQDLMRHFDKALTKGDVTVIFINH